MTIDDATAIARTQHQEAVTALQTWRDTNMQRTELATTVQAAMVRGDESSEALSAYMKLSEVEMVHAGAAIFALSQCLVVFDAAYRAKIGKSIIELSVPGGT